MCSSDLSACVCVCVCVCVRRAVSSHLVYFDSEQHNNDACHVSFSMTNQPLCTHAHTHTCLHIHTHTNTHNRCTHSHTHMQCRHAVVLLSLKESKAFEHLKYAVEFFWTTARTHTRHWTWPWKGQDVSLQIKTPLLFTSFT